MKIVGIINNPNVTNERSVLLRTDPAVTWEVLNKMNKGGAFKAFSFSPQGGDLQVVSVVNDGVRLVDAIEETFISVLEQQLSAAESAIEHEKNQSDALIHKYSKNTKLPLIE